MKRLAVLVIALTVSACGNGSDGPSTAPTRVVQVGGVWGVSSTVASASGGECFASGFQSLVGQRGAGTIQIQQSGGSLTATITDDSTGGSCNYSGTAGANSVALNASSCTSSDVLGARCPTTGAMRNIRLVTAAFNGTVAGNTISGTSAETYNVTTSAGAGLGTATVNFSFTATRR